MQAPMNSLTPEAWLEQAALLREIQHLKTAARLLAIGRPERARASEAALDLAKAREAQISNETQNLLAKWHDVTSKNALTHVPSLSDHGDQLIWLLQNVQNLDG